jgi:hypothetical protein
MVCCSLPKQTFDLLRRIPIRLLPRNFQILAGHRDLTSPENPAIARRLNSHPTRDWK